MKNNKTAARVFYHLSRRLKFPVFVILLCTSVTVLYLWNWDVIFPKVFVSTQKQDAHISDFTVSTKYKSSELHTDSNTKLSSPERKTSPEFHSTTSEVQTNQKTKLHMEDTSSTTGSIHLDTIQLTKQPERRRSLLIYAADRSGSTFTAKMFAKDTQLMTVYEPLWITRQWIKEENQQLPNWRRNVMDILKAILGCKFAESDAASKFLSGKLPFIVKNPFKSPAFCVNETACKNLSTNPSYADEVCLTKFKHSITKIGEPRTPDHLISSFLPALFTENPETDIRVIQLVRDPRGSMNSRIKLQWMKDNEAPNLFKMRVSSVCANLAENIKFGRNLGKWQEKYLEVHYRDLTVKPIETTQAMYKFAGFEMPDSVLDWVVRNTSPSEEELLKAQNKTFSSIRNSTAIVNKWQQESPFERLRIIERLCSEALDLLGLAKIAENNGM